jgi:hypothetical protein
LHPLISSFEISLQGGSREATHQPATSSGDGPNVEPSGDRLERAPRADETREAARLLSADGSQIPIDREPGEAGETERASRSGLSARRSQTIQKLLNAGPSPVAVSAFAAGVVAGVLVGALWARR